MRMEIRRLRGLPAVLTIVAACTQDLPFVPGDDIHRTSGGTTPIDTPTTSHATHPYLSWTWGCLEFQNEARYVFELDEVGTHTSDALMVLDCPSCRSPVEFHALPHLGRGRYELNLADNGTYDPGVSTAIGCTDELGVPWVWAFRASLDQDIPPYAFDDELLCYVFEDDGGPDGYFEAIHGPDWGCLGWPYETGGIE